MTENDKINGWTFEETVKTATNLMEVENNMFKWDVLRHLRDFAEMYEEEVQQYRALGNIEELRHAKEKHIPKKIVKHDKCPVCNNSQSTTWYYVGASYCEYCGQKLSWESDTD